jgi:ATP-dependent helicase IRC3
MQTLYEGCSMLTLRPYQIEAVEAVLTAESRGIRRPLIALPTGTGKTVVFAHLLLQRPGRSLVLVHRDELIQHAYAKLKEIDPSRSIGIVKAERDEHSAPTVIASVPTLAREARLTRLTPDFRTIVVDEAHHAVADSYRRILAHCGAFAEGGPLTLGVTATPQRGDDVGLDAVFQEVVYQKSIRDMILAGYLADLKALRIGIKADSSSLHTRMGDFQDSKLEAMLLECDAPGLIVQAYQEHARTRKALLVTPTVKVAHVIAAAFQQCDIDAEALDGTTPTEERRALLKRLKTGETRLVANCGVLTEGFDEPSVDAIIIARPTKSSTLYTQMVGRGTRIYPGKQDCLVMDLVGVTRRHDLQSVATLVGLPLEALSGGTSVGEAVAEQAAQQQRQARHGALVAQSVSLFRQRPLHWLTQGKAFALSLGEAGWILLSPDPESEAEHWSMVLYPSEGFATNCSRKGISHR